MSTPTATPAAYTRRPSCAPGTEIHPPMGDDGGQWVLQKGPRYIRVGASVARLAERMDGQRDHADLAEVLGRPWSEALVSRTVQQLDDLGLIDRGDTAAPRRPSRMKIVPPFTLQLTLLRPGPTMQRMRPFFSLIANRFVVLAAVLVAVAGFAALAVRSGEVTRVLGEPLPATTYVGVLLGLVVGTSIHELGHAATLIHYGGRPSRIGVMLFYLMPAFFCDVSDSWRLPHRNQRVRVALAGPAVQTFLAGAAALAVLVTEPSGFRDGLLFFAVGGYVTGALNLLPFVKLDGYLALMTRIDVPYLRDRATGDARRAVARLLFGGTYQRELTSRWTTLYGLACLCFPLYLLSTALTVWIGVLQRGGILGLLLVLCGFLYALYFLVRGGRRLAREVRAAGAARWRVLTVTAALAAGLGALAFVPQPYAVQAAYVTRDGAVELVLLDGSDAAGIEAGQRVELLRNGAVLHTRVGAAAVTTGQGTAGTAPLSSFFPVTLAAEPDLPVTGYALTLTPGERPDAESGAARVLVGDLPLWEVVYRGYLKPFL
ncbi:daptide biosynthesis intramembrane metalloprotease [Streptomyces sp. NPDC051569]|uniref:daptide biosynthesis intramembrane metalloprotease n=1 Tax=Streptomyces sp. NPDC051569 TaxID=3365661 RepID=UPI00379C55F9